MENGHRNHRNTIEIVIAIEHGHRNTIEQVVLPIRNGEIPRAMLGYQRVIAVHFR